MATVVKKTVTMVIFDAAVAINVAMQTVFFEILLVVGVLEVYVVLGFSLP